MKGVDADVATTASCVGQPAPGSAAPDEYARLSPRLQLVNLKFKQILYEAQAPIEHIYFPIRVVLSAVIFMENGNAIEVATTGSEGMVGLPALFQVETSLTHVFVQIAGDALQMRADTLKEEGTREGPFRRLLISYQSAVPRASLTGRGLQRPACHHPALLPMAADDPRSGARRFVPADP